MCENLESSLAVRKLAVLQSLLSIHRLFFRVLFVRSNLLLVTRSYGGIIKIDETRAMQNTWHM